MMENNNERMPAFDEFSPKKILRAIRTIWAYVRSKLKWILGLAILSGIIGASIAYFKKPLYAAEITFALDEEKALHNKSEFSEFSEQLGLAPIDGGNVFSNVNNIAELIKSRLIIEKTLRSTVKIHNKEILFANFFLDSLDWRDKWLSSSAYPKLVFNTSKKDSNEVWFENGILKNMYKKLTGEYLKINPKGKGTTISSVVCETRHPLFSKYFVEALMNEVTTYYINAKTERSRINLDIIQKRTDSVRQAYVQALYGRAVFSDADINLVRESFSVPGERKQTDAQILRAAYIDLSRNLESAKTSLMNNTPIIQIVDSPVLPLDIKKPGLVKQFLLFFFIGGFLSFAAYILRYFWKLFAEELRETESME